jgi:hypothetical protein
MGTRYGSPDAIHCICRFRLMPQKKQDLPDLQPHLGPLRDVPPRLCRKYNEAFQNSNFYTEEVIIPPEPCPTAVPAETLAGAKGKWNPFPRPRGPTKEGRNPALPRGTSTPFTSTYSKHTSVHPSAEKNTRVVSNVRKGGVHATGKGV